MNELSNSEERIARIIKLLFGFILLLVLWRLTWILFSMDYPAYFKYVTGLVFIFDAADQPIYLKLFIALRGLALAVLLLFTYKLYRTIIERRRLFSKKEDNFFNTLALSFSASKNYLASIGRENRFIFFTILAMQFVAVSYFIINLPYHVDEAFSYTYFSGRGFITTIAFYPQPNNHVFYNVISGIMLMLPVDTITAVRLPNLLTGLLTSFYFFKLAGKLMSVRWALIASAMFTFSFPFLFYSFQARGYEFILFFSTLVFYAFVNIAEGNNVKKYLAVYAISSILGFYTIPTYLYFIVPLGMVLFLMFIIKPQLKLWVFFKAHIYIAAFTILLYLPIIIRNGLDSLISSQGVATVKTLEYIRENIQSHLNDTWGFLVNTNALPIYCVVVLVLALLIMLLRMAVSKRFTTMLIIFMLVSPVPIIFLHKVIPFPRTWMFMIIPLALSIGIILQLIFSFVKLNKVTPLQKTAMVAAFVVLWAGIMVGKAEKGHKSMLGVDFVIRDYVKALSDKLSSVTKVQRTEDFSFYISDDLEFETTKRGQVVHYSVVHESDSLIGDIILTGKESKLKLTDNYKLVPVTNEYFNVYIRKDL